MIAGMQAFSDVGKVRKNQEDAYYIGVHPQNKDFNYNIDKIIVLYYLRP